MAARSGTDLTWSPQLRNLAEWDWVPIFLENKYGGEYRHQRTMSFCSVLSFPASRHQEKVFMNFFNEFLEIRRRDVWTVHGWLHLSWFGISASSVIYKLREFSSNQPSLHLLYFSTYSGIKNSLPYPKHMLRAHYISMSLATVIWECSLNQFSTSLFVSLFVHREPQQIFMGVNTEYRANLVKARVNVPIALLHIYLVCQNKLFLISQGGRGLLNLKNFHWNIIWVISNKFPTAIPVLSSFILDGEFGFKYFLEIVCTKITL